MTEPATIQVDASAIELTEAQRSLASQNNAVSESAKTLATKDLSRTEIKPLTSLRFLAAFVVLLAHGRESFTCWRGVSEASTFGQAVTFFFVMSGFILTHVYFNLEISKGEIRKFIQARIARIWPAHVLSLFLLIALIPEVFKIRSADLPRFLCNLFLVQAWIPSWREFFSYNASSWSISCEFFFYLIFPLLLWGLRKKWYLPLLTTGSIVLAIIIYGNTMHLPEFSATGLSSQGITYIHPFSRVFDFCVGMLMAQIWRKRLRHLSLSLPVATAIEFGTLVLVCLAYMFSNQLRYFMEPSLGISGAYWLQNSGPSLIGFALLVTVFAMEKGLFSRFLSLPVMVLLGELSFPIYMLHGVFLTYLAINFPQQDSVAACTIFCIAIIMASHLMFELAEKPMRSLLMKVGRKNKTPAKGAAKSRSLKMPLILATEAIAFTALIYFSLPGIHKISTAEASNLSQVATVSMIDLPPYLRCRAASAKVKDGKVVLNTVWEALKAQPINFSIRAIVVDQNNNALGSMTYKQDGLNQRVKAGTCWTEQIDIAAAADKNSRVDISVLRNRRETLHSPSKTSGDLSFTVPVR